MLRFSDSEKRLLLKAKYVGHTIIKRLEDIGVSNLQDLSLADATMLCHIIEADSGIKGWGTHTLALQAISNAIDVAKEYCYDAN